MPRGRKRKPGNRYPCGRRTRIETECEAMSVALEARQRQFAVTARQARDQRLGTSLGRLSFKAMISDMQYQAGVQFADLYQHHHAVMGLPRPNPSSVAGLLINEGIFAGSSTPADKTTVATLHRRFEEATAALDQCDREHRLSPGRRPALLIYRVICVDEDTIGWLEEDIGNLRVALNALVRVFRIR